MVTPLPTHKEAQLPLHLLQAIRNDAALLLVGSGMSVSLGYPTLKDLIEKIFETVQSALARTDPPNMEWVRSQLASTPDWVAEVIQSASPDKYSAAIRSTFTSPRSRSVSLNHLLTALLPFRGYLTTNYDSLVEDYLSVFSADDIPVFDYSEALKNYAEFTSTRRYVLKLHGCAKKDPERIVLTSRQYYELLNDQRYIRLLASLFSSFTTLCVGFSMRDKDFRSLLEERHHLYERRCPPLYAVIPEGETCPLELALLRDRYNVHLITVSRDNNFAELTALLYSLYCLVFGEDSSTISDKFLAAAANKVHEKHLVDLDAPEHEEDHIRAAKSLLSHFRDSLRPEAFIAFCMECGVRLSPAELNAFADRSLNGRISLRVRTEDSALTREKIAKWVAAELESVPVALAPRHFTAYHKELFHLYSRTLTYLLKHEECWKHIVGVQAEAVPRLNRICQFFKQEGRWSEWLDIAEAAAAFVKESDSVFKPLMQSMLWVYFWTRRFAKVKELLERFPDLDDGAGEHNYADRLRYMRPENLDALIRDIEAREKRDYFAKSMLGRSYARLSLRKEPKRPLLQKAVAHLREAMADASKSGDWIEKSVQSWYLAIVLSDLGEIIEAKHQLAEVRRLDESIMNRVPGIAWLALADYRIAASDSPQKPEHVSELRTKTIRMFKDLGTVDIESFIDKEYYY